MGMEGVSFGVKAGGEFVPFPFLPFWPLPSAEGTCNLSGSGRLLVLSRAGICSSFAAPTYKQMKNQHSLLPVVRTWTIVLTSIIVPAALFRYLLPHDWHVWLFKPFYGDYIPAQTDILASIPVQEFLHRLGGVAYIVIGLLQFSKSFRKRKPKLHRNLGKAFLLLSLALGIGGIVMSIIVPAAGLQETVPTVLFAGLFIFFTLKAYQTARQKRFLEHREWVIRNFALGIGVATIRVYAAIFINFSPLTIEEVVITTFWLGWTTNMILAEAWIHVTRPKARKRVKAS